jgi:pimeloyl-ACP methyl ester carboxylesterase
MEAARAPGGPIGNSTIDHAAAEMNSKSAGGPSDSTAIQPTNQPSQEELILNLMRPERVAKIDLAPDGRHLAFVAVDKYRVRLIIVDFDHLENPASMDIGEGSWWRQMMGANWNAPRVTFLRWATASRLIFAEGDNAIYAVNADGKGLTKLIAAADVGVVKGPDISSLAETPPPGMPLPPNQLDQMAGSPSTNMDPALRVAGPYSGPAITTPAITQNLDMADPRSNSYINNGSSPDRATDPTAVLGGGNQADLPSDLIPRTPRVIAMPPEDPEHIIVEGSGVQDPLSGLYYDGLFKVDIESGARVPLGEAKLPGHQFMYDQAGRLRIVLGSISHTYLHVFPGRAMWRSAKPLDKLVRDPANRGFEAKPETFFGAHAIPIGFDYNPDILYYASNQGRDTMGLYSIDLKSGEKTGFSVESPDSDVVDPSLAGSPEGPGESVDPLVFDRHLRQLVGVRVAGFAPSTRWFDSGLAQIQTRLEQKFADRTVKLLQWDDRRTRFLALVTGPMDPGRFYVYTPAGEQLVLCARRAPWIPSSSACRTSSLVFSAGDGTLLTGSVTEARNSRIHPPPLVVLCPDGPGYAPLSADFDRDAQAFAGMGFAVLRVNYRGTGGLGLKHLGSVRNGIDRVPLGDIVSAIDSIRAQTPIDPKRIAIVGEGFGGYLALRAVQIYPERFRCAVAIRAPVNLGQWVREPDLIANTRARSEDAAAFQTIIAEQNAGNPLLTLDALHATVNQPPPAPPSEDTPELFLAKARIAFFGNDRKAFEAISPSRSPDDLNRPIFLIQDDTADSGFLVSAGALRSAIEKRGGQADLITIHGRLEDMDAGDHAKVLAQIEAFLNIDFYTYDVEIGAVKTKE